MTHEGSTQFWQPLRALVAQYGGLQDDELVGERRRSPR
jgi:hypothetical protein